MLAPAVLIVSVAYRPCILSAVAWAESRNNWLAVAGTHRGPYQIAVRHSRIPWWIVLAGLGVVTRPWGRECPES